MALTQLKTSGIADDAVTTDKLANAINTERTANTAKTSLEDNAVTLAKMAGGTDGQIITYDASGDPVAVGPGTDGQVLTSTGAGSPPAFENASTGAALTGSTDNTITTVTGANAIQGEANLTFDGTTFQTQHATGAIARIQNTTAATSQAASLELCPANGLVGNLVKSVSEEDFSTGANRTAYLSIEGRKDGTLAERLRIESGGNLKIVDGDLVIGTAGHGIDFSAQTASSATGATTGDEILDHYEEGTWTPRMVYYNAGSGGWDNACSFTDAPAGSGTGVYTRIGNMVYVQWYSTLFNMVTGSGESAGIDGLPFVNNGTDNVLSTAHANCFEQSGHNGYVASSTSLLVFTRIDNHSVNTWTTNNAYIMVSAWYNI